MRPPGILTPAEGPVKPVPPEQLETSDPRYQQLKAKLKPNFTNLEDLFPKVVSEIRQLILGYRTEGIVSRRWEAMRMRQAHLYWMGIQGGYYDPADWQWHMPYGSSVGLGLGVEDGADDYESPEYDYVTNYYQAYGLDFQALMSAKIPTPKFYPQSAQSEQDITTAKAADDVRKLNEKNNSPKKLARKYAWLDWCDGKTGGYVRWVRDAARFGTEDLNEFDTDLSKVGDDAYSCPNCHADNPAPDNQGGLLGTNICQQCGTEMSDEDFKPADYVPIPKQTGSKKVAKGAVVISLIPGLQFHTPPWANEQHEFPYLQWNLECHKALLKAQYPDAAPKITAGGPASADDVQMRAWRLQVQQGLPVSQPGDALAQLVTFSRTWIRSWSLWEIEDKNTREQILDIFGEEGIYVAFAGEAYCESRPESMESCWRVSHAMEGDGQNRPSVGDSSIQVQAQINDLSNIEQESAEYGIPVTAADSETFNMDAMQHTKARPGDVIPVKVRNQEALSDKVWQGELASIDAGIAQRRNDLAGPVLQRLTGIQPAAFGAQDAPGDAAAKYSMEREQALQRIGLFYAEWGRFYGALHLLGVTCYRDNAPGDTELPTEQEGGGFESTYIRMADLQGNIEIYEEPDDSYPALPSEVKSIAVQMLNDPVIGQMFATQPGNVRRLKDMLGFSDFTAAGEDEEIKTMRAIKRLMKSPPIMQPPQIDPMTGQVTQPPPQPTEKPDPDLDDLPSLMSEIRRWFQSDKGQQEVQQQPAGFANVRAYYQLAKTMAAAQQQPPAAKPPSESINFKDLPPDGQAQMAQQSGIKLDPAQLAIQQQEDKLQKSKESAMKLQSLQVKQASVRPEASA